MGDQSSAIAKTVEDFERLKQVEKEMHDYLGLLERTIAEEEERHIASSPTGNILMRYDFAEGQKKEKKAHLFSESSSTWPKRHDANKGQP